MKTFRSSEGSISSLALSFGKTESVRANP